MRTALLALAALGCAAPQAATPWDAHTTEAVREPAGLAPAGCRVEGERLSDVSFEVVAPRTTFRRGERITLQLRFSSEAEDTYQLDAATYDRSGRLTLDYFLVADDGTADPLADLFGRAGGMVMGGLRSMPMLVAEPTVVDRDLNEHVRFDEPGRYLVQVSTSRVARDEGRVECVAAPIELTITPPDEAADRAAIEVAVRKVADPDAPEEETHDAARVLRYSTSADAVPAMVGLLGRTDDDWDRYALTFGLYGTPHREAAARALEEAVAAPDVAVVDAHLRALSSLRHWIAFPDPLPDRPEDAAAQERWDAEREARSAARGETDEAIARGLAEALPRKTEEAARVSLATLLEVALSGREVPAWLGQVGPLLGERLATLPADARSTLLRHRWRQIASPALVPALRALVDDRDDEEGRAIALRRLYELEPEEGRARVEAQLRADEIDLGYEAEAALTALPPDAFGASLDEPLVRAVEHFDHQAALRAALLSRYASPAVADRVRAVLASDAELWAAPRGALWAYLLRVEPRRAAPELARTIEAANGQNARRRAAGALEALAAHGGWHRSLDAVAIALLESEDVEVVRHAARALELQGGAEGALALAARLRRLLDPYRGDPTALESGVFRSGEPVSEARSLAHALRQAITGAEGHLPTDAALAALQDACATEECRVQVGHARDRAARRPIAVRVSLHQSGEVEVILRGHMCSRRSVSLARPGGGARAFVIEGQPASDGAAVYRAEAIDWLLSRLAELPAGTAVQIQTWPEEGLEVDALRGRLDAWLRARGLQPAG